MKWEIQCKNKTSEACKIWAPVDPIASSRYKLYGLAPSSCVVRSFFTGNVYPKKASFSKYLPSISADENPQGPMKAEARGSLQGSQYLPSMAGSGNSGKVERSALTNIDIPFESMK